MWHNFIRANICPTGDPEGEGTEGRLEEGMATHSSISCLENPLDRGAWWATVHGVAKSQT